MSKQDHATREVNIYEGAAEYGERASELCEADNNEGICLCCGAERSGVEPDAEYYHCDECGRAFVFGVEQIVLMSCAAGMMVKI